MVNKKKMNEVFKYAKAYEALAKAISTATEDGLYNVKTVKKVG